MRAGTVTAFMDEFGDVIYNNYNATEVGMIATATPHDLRAAPDTAGKPMPGVDVRILDEDRRELPHGQIGQIFARSASHSTSTPPAKRRSFTADSWPPAMSDTSTKRAGCSSWVETRT
jgi:fatty-acyl-CoA synthase